jgi:hypothetical protein
MAQLSLYKGGGRQGVDSVERRDVKWLGAVTVSFRIGCENASLRLRAPHLSYFKAFKAMQFCLVDMIKDFIVRNILLSIDS